MPITQITRTLIKDAEIITTKLPSNAVTTVKINALAVTEGKIAVGAVTLEKQATIVVATGSSNTFVVALSPAPSSYVTNARYSFKANHNITGSATVNFNSLGAKTLKKIETTGSAVALIADDIRNTQYVETIYDGTDLIVISALASRITAASSGSWVLIETKTISGAIASIDFESGIDSTYDAYVMVVSGLQTVSQVSVNFFVGTGGTPTYATTSYNGTGEWVTQAGAISTRASVTNKWELTNGPLNVGLGSTDSFSAVIHLFNLASTSHYKHMVAQVAYTPHTQTFIGGYVYGQYSSATAVTALRIKADSGNIDVAVVSLYGIAK